MVKLKNKKINMVFAAVRDGKSLYAACMTAEMSTREFYDAIADDENLRCDFYLALADYADKCVDDIKNLIASLKKGEIDTSSAKLLIETQKWLAQKICPENVLDDEVFNHIDDEKKLSEIVVKFV